MRLQNWEPSVPLTKSATSLLTPDEEKKLAPYVTQVGGRVFCLRNLPEEVVAVLFAYYSRSRDDLQRNLLRLLNDQSLDIASQAIDDALGRNLSFAESKAREFHEKWVVGYGHASVAEHAVAHVALEQVSIVASKVIEDARLAAYTEKSTRYVLFDQDSFVSLNEVLPPELANIYDKAASSLLATYVSLYEPLVERIRQRVPRAEGQAERAYEASVRAQACDVLRYLLPCGTRTHIGMTANGRVLEHLIKKMMGHPLSEIQALGQAIHRQAGVVIPTLLKYVDPSPHRTDLAKRTATLLDHPLAQLRQMHAPAAVSHKTVLHAPTEGSEVRVIAYDRDALDRVISGIVYEQADAAMMDVAAVVRSMSAETKHALWKAYVSDRGKYDAPLRALEHTSMTLELVLDQGAFRDLQRHRMQSQNVPLLSFSNGYTLHDASEALGVAEVMREAIEAVFPVWEQIHRTHPMEAQYVVPLAARRRYVITMNLREAFHFIELRSGRQGHVSYRRVAQQIYRALQQIHPWATEAMRVDMQDYTFARS